MESDMNEVRTGIYVGSISAISSGEELNRCGITHILTVHATPPESQIDGITYKYVCKLDMPEVDLLSHFKECFEFIDEALSKNGKVLIHCFAGASRSATIAIAYVMYRDKMSLTDTITIVKKHRPRIRPNVGFMEQLELFDQMDGVIDANSALYRKYKLSVLAQRVQSGSLEEVKATDLGNTTIDKTQSFYRCRKCRQALFKSTSLLTHTLGEGESAFDWRCKAPGAPRPAEDILLNQPEEDTVCDKSLFIEPVQWMADVINQLEGKLQCPKCQVKLGSFVWYGEKCPCGTWVAPAFHIQTSKVDHIKPVPTLGAQCLGPAVALMQMGTKPD